jgi:hypothetical protein
MMGLDCRRLREREEEEEEKVKLGKEQATKVAGISNNSSRDLVFPFFFCATAWLETIFLEQKVEREHAVDTECIQWKQ